MGDQASPAQVLGQLGAVGIDFSVPEPDLLDWLGNPDFTPYPALASALLGLLRERRLKQPVFIDVIAFNYENTPGVASPRRVEDVDTTVLRTAVVEGFNERYGQAVTDFTTLLSPLADPPMVTPVLAGLLVEGTTKVENGVQFVDTDNPQIEVGTTLTTVPAVWANGPVPQELQRQQLAWQFANGDAVFSVGDGEADAQNRPVRAGSLNEDAYAWPKTDGQFSGARADQVTLIGRIRVAYRPLTVKLLVSGPKGFASNTGQPFRVALDPDVLLVPVETVRFFSPDVPVAGITAAGQLALWDHVPIIGATANTKNTDGGTGELRLAARAWDAYPTPSPPEGLYQHQGWVSPDSIWGKARIRFRLVNHIDIQTDNAHTIPPRVDGGSNDTPLRENRDTLTRHPQHIADKSVVSVIYMQRIASPEAPEIGRALIGLNTIGISVGAADKFATIAHEIGHLISGSQGHSTLNNNVMNDPGPGTDITDQQIDAARAWAKGFADFWQHV